jgi:hypothetical protein
MRCALVTISYSVSKRLLPVTGLESAGFDRCAISLFASRPGKKSYSPLLSLGHRNISQHERPIWFILREQGPGHAGEFIR